MIDLLLNPQPTWWQFVLLFLLNLLFSVPLAFMFWFLLPKRFQLRRTGQPIKWEIKWGIIALLLCICTFVPILGAIALLIGVLLLYAYGKQTQHYHLHHVDYPAFTAEKPIHLLDFGEGGATRQVQTKSLTTTARTKALLAINLAHNSAVNKINQVLLHDDIDELRLYANNLLEKQESDINTHINHALDQLAQVHTDQQRAQLRKQLALLYWKLKQLNLVEGEFLQYIIKRAHTYAEQALHLLKQDVDLALLMAEIYLHQHDYSKAGQTLAHARAYAAQNDALLAQSAKLSFIARRFDQVRDYLSRNPSLSDQPSLGLAVQFWCRT